MTGSRPRLLALASSLIAWVRMARLSKRFGDKLDLSDRIEMPGTTTTQGRFTNLYVGELGPKRRKVAVNVLRDPHLGGCNPDSQPWTSVIGVRLQDVMPMWTQVVHARIVPYLGYAVINGVPAVVTEWCPNGTVKNYMRDPKANKRALVRQIADGLEHLHTRKHAIVQGDLKPDNVMIGHDKKAMLSNYGLSSLIEQALGQEEALGEYRDTVRYTAPELLNGESCSVRSDVYAFACVALEIMTGKQPFVMLNSDLAVKRAKTQGRTPSPLDYPSLPAEDPLWNLLQRCFDKDAHRRPTMSQVVVELSSLGYKP